MLYLSIEVVEVELILANLLLQFLCLLKVELLLSTLYQRNHVTHTENTVGHTGRMEHVDSLHLLASTDKLDRLGYHSADTESSTTTGITIKLGKNHAIEIKTVVKLLGCIDSILTRHRVNNKMILKTADLVHHLLVNGQTTGSIHDDNIVAIGLSLLDGMVGNDTNILVLRLTVYRNTHLLSYHLQLVDSSRTINVASHEQWLLSLLGLEHIGIVNQLYHQLTRLYSREHIHTKCLFLHLVGEFLSYLEVDVGVEQSTAYVLHGLCHVDFGYLTLTLQNLEGSFQSIT